MGYMQAQYSRLYYLLFPTLTINCLTKLSMSFTISITEKDRCKDCMGKKTKREKKILEVGDIEI